MTIDPTDLAAEVAMTGEKEEKEVTEMIATIVSETLAVLATAKKIGAVELPLEVVVHLSRTAETTTETEISRVVQLKRDLLTCV